MATDRLPEIKITNSGGTQFWLVDPMMTGALLQIAADTGLAPHKLLEAAITSLIIQGVARRLQ